MSDLENPPKSGSAPNVFGRIVRFFIWGGVGGGLIGGTIWGYQAWFWTMNLEDLCVFAGIGAFAGGTLFVAIKTLPLGIWALLFGISGSSLCGMLIVVILVAVFYIRPGDRGFGYVFCGFIPLAFIPTALLCMVGAILSDVARKRNSSSTARIGLRLSIAGPAIAVVFYALGCCAIQFVGSL